MFLYFNLEDIKSFTFMPLERFLHTSEYQNWFRHSFPSSQDPSLVIDQKMEAKIYREKDSSFLPVWSHDQNCFNGFGEKSIVGFAKIVPWVRHPFIDIERLENDVIEKMRQKTELWHKLGRPTQKSILLRILHEQNFDLIDSYHALYEDRFQEILKSGWDDLAIDNSLWDAGWFDPKDQIGSNTLIEPMEA